MKTEIHTVTREQSAKSVLALFEEKKIRHAPVVEGENVVGVITDRDLKVALPSRFAPADALKASELKVRDIMTENPVTAHPLDIVEEIAVIFYEQQIGCLPVVRNGRLVGFLTETDLLYAYIELTGAHQPGSHIELRVPNRSGELYEVTKVFYEQKVNVLSVLVYPDKENKDHKILAFRIQTMNPLAITKRLREEGYEILWPKSPQLDR